MKKRIFLLAALAAGLVLCLAACGETNGDPVTVTLWHVYGGEVNSPMNALVDEFNRTVGQEQGIRVRPLSGFYHGEVPEKAAHCLVISYASLPGDRLEALAEALSKSFKRIWEKSGKIM